MDAQLWFKEEFRLEDCSVGARKMDGSECGVPRAERSSEQPTATVCSTDAASASDGLTSCVEWRCSSATHSLEREVATDHQI